MTRSRKRGRKGIPLWPLVILAGLAVAATAFWLAVHLLILAGFVILAGGAFYMGRQYERRRTVRPRPTIQARVVPASNPAADQIAHLEQLAARPIEAIIASYERVQQKYGSRA